MMNGIKNIVWANDGSVEAKKALELAVSIARPYGAAIHGVYVSMVPQDIAFSLSKSVTDELYQWMLKAEDRYASDMEEVSKSLGPEPLDFDWQVRKGKPSEQIVEFAAEVAADLIVMGNKGVGLIGQLLVGSTTLNTLKISHVPVLGVHDNSRPPEIRKILVPVDMGQSLDNSLDMALPLAAKLGATVDVLYVFRLDAYAFEIPVNILESMVESSSTELKSSVKGAVERAGLTPNGITVEEHVLHGVNPVVCITDFAEDNEIDLIVLSTHGRKGVQRFFLGSVTEMVLQRTDRQVLVLKPE